MWLLLSLLFITHMCMCFRWAQDWCIWCFSTVSWAEVLSCTVWLQWSLCCSVSPTSCFISRISQLLCPNSSWEQRAFRYSTHLLSAVTMTHAWTSSFTVVIPTELIPISQLSGLFSRLLTHSFRFTAYEEYTHHWSIGWDQLVVVVVWVIIAPVWRDHIVPLMLPLKWISWLKKSKKTNKE